MPKRAAGSSPLATKRSNAAPPAPKTQLTLAQAATFSVCEAFTRFSSRVTPITSSIVKRKPKKGIPCVAPSDITDDAREVIKEYSDVKKKYISQKDENVPKIRKLKREADESREQLQQHVHQQPEKQLYVHLDEPAPIPSTMYKDDAPRLPEGVKDQYASESESESGDEGSDEESDEQEALDKDRDASESARPKTDWERELFGDDNASVRSASSFRVTEKIVYRSKGRIKTNELKGIVLGATTTVLQRMGVDPIYPVTQAALSNVLGNMSFWDDVLALVTRNVQEASTLKKIDKFVVYIKQEKEERAKTGVEDDSPSTFFYSILRKGGFTQ